MAHGERFWLDDVSDAHAVPLGQALAKLRSGRHLVHCSLTRVAVAVWAQIIEIEIAGAGQLSGEQGRVLDVEKLSRRLRWLLP